MNNEELSTSQQAFISALEVNMDNATKACKAAGIARSTYYVWLDESDVFAQAVNDVREGLIDKAESVLYGHMFDEKSLDATKYYLDRKGKGRGYVSKTEQIIEHDVSAGMMDRMAEARKRAGANANSD